MPRKRSISVPCVSERMDTDCHGICSDLATFSPDELAVISRVLVTILHASGFRELIDEIQQALSRLCQVDGCALYRISDHELGLTLAFGAGNFGSYLPDIVPRTSNLYQVMSSNAFTDVAFTRQVQPSLFDDHPSSIFGPIFLNDRLMGVLTVLHREPDARFIATVMREAVIAVELLCKADTFASTLSLRADFGQAAKSQPEPEPSPPDEPAVKLTPREKEVLLLLAKGLSNKEIASRLYISSATCKHHVENILSKLQAPNRAAAVAMGLAYVDEGVYP